MNNIHYLHGFVGGKNGEVNIASPCTAGDYDFIIVEAGVTFTVLADAAIKRVDIVHLNGDSGTAEIVCDAVAAKTVTFGTSLTATAAAFVVDHGAAYTAGDVVVTSLGTDIIFTAITAGTDFTGATSITRLTGNLHGGVELKTANKAAVNLLTTKNLGSVAFASERILSAGTGNKIKTLTFSGGLVWGYTLETGTI
jgi:hypothetical protein